MIFTIIKMKSFNVENIMCWGLDYNKEYGGYTLPVSFSREPEIEEKIVKLVKKHKAKEVFYGDSKTIYFRLWNLSETQKRDLLGTGVQRIDLQFEIEDEPRESKNGVTYLCFNVTGLRKSKESLEMAPKDEF